MLPEVSRWRVLEKTQCQCCGRCALCLATCRRAAITHRGKWRFPDTPGLSHFQPETHSCFHLISPLCFPSFCWEPAARYRLSDEHKERALISQRPAIPASLCQQATQSRRHTKAPLVPLLSRKEAPVSNSHREHSSANKLRCSFHCAHYRKDDSSKSVSEPTFMPLGRFCKAMRLPRNLKLQPRIITCTSALVLQRLLFVHGCFFHKVQRKQDTNQACPLDSATASCAHPHKEARTHTQHSWPKRDSVFAAFIILSFSNQAERPVLGGVFLACEYSLWCPVLPDQLVSLGNKNPLLRLHAEPGPKHEENGKAVLKSR